MDNSRNDERGNTDRVSPRRYNFTTVEKRGVVTRQPVSKVVRVYGKGLGISGDLLRRFRVSRTGPNDYGRYGYNLVIRIDDVNQAIQLLNAEDAPSESNFRFNSASADSYATLNFPSALKQAALPKGDYVEVEGEHNVFVLAK